MQYVNDDKDDLFRRAGKEYPLTTKGLNWQKVANTLYPEQVSTNEPTQNKRFCLIWMLLLIVFPWVCNQTVNQSDKTATLNSLEGEVLSPLKKAEGNQDKNNLSTSKRGTTFFVPQQADRIKTTIHTQRDLDNRMSKQPPGGGVKQLVISSLIEDSNYSYKNITATTLRQFPVSLIDGPADTLKSFALQQPIMVTRGNISELHKYVPADSLSRFYLGIVFGGSLTTVKFRQVRNSGIDVGLAAGFSINKRWSLETGILSGQKKYFAAGKDWRTTKMHLPPDTKITSVEGNCQMLEWPIAVRYSFPRTRYTWSLSSGVSSFIMKQEDYDYECLYLNSGRKARYQKVHKDGAFYGLSAWHLAGGFRYHLPGQLAVQADAYWQLPLKETGLGSLPLTTIGLRIGIVKSVF